MKIKQVVRRSCDDSVIRYGSSSTSVGSDATRPSPTSQTNLLPTRSSGGGKRESKSPAQSPPRVQSRVASTRGAAVIGNSPNMQRNRVHSTRYTDNRALAELGRTMAGRRMALAQHKKTDHHLQLIKRRKNSSRRLVLKSGDCNVAASNITRRHRKYLFDLFTTLVDMRWRWHIVTFVATFIGTWSVFAVLWFILSFLTVSTGRCIGDEQTGSESSCSSENVTELTSCVRNVHDFTSALLFSIETQATIGYGYRYPENCPLGVILMMTQTCVGLFLQCLVTGILFVKISRPKGRAQTIIFSRKAVICKRDGRYCFLFRVGDVRRSHVVGTSLRALMVRNRLTDEGESIPLCQSPLHLETETTRSDSFLFLKWPVTVTHWVGDETSPLWDLSADDLHGGSVHFEIIVVMEGTIESTGMLTQVRTSYIPSEIAWGERLCPLVTYQRNNGQYTIDFEQFHQTLPCPSMPSCSARRWTELVQEARQTPATLGLGSTALLQRSLSVHGENEAPANDQLLAQQAIMSVSMADLGQYDVNFTLPAVRFCCSPSTQKGQQADLIDSQQSASRKLRQLFHKRRLSTGGNPNDSVRGSKDQPEVDGEPRRPSVCAALVRQTIEAQTSDRIELVDLRV